MRIEFGLHLDGLDPTPPRTSYGEIAVGPQGFIRMLESDLGLPPVLDHPAQQLVAYRGCLDEADTPERFYHRSLAVDAIAVAATLQRWREQWYEAGWDGTFDLAAPHRLRDMAAVEAIAQDRVPLCSGQRVTRILASMTSRRTQVTELILRTPPEHLPAVWRRLVEALGYTIEDGLQPTPRGTPGSDLHQVQSVLLARAASDAESTQAIPLNSDDSFVIVRAASRDISARAVAESLLVHNEIRGTAILAEQDGIIIDNAMERSGLPRCGFQHYSSFRAVSQVLKLSLALLWKPIDPHLLLQFLNHPLAPVPTRIRNALADAVANAPGIGGEEWVKSIVGLEQRMRDAGATDANIKHLRATITEWFESPRHPPAEGAPIQSIATRTQAVATWLVARLANLEEPGERAMFGSALGQAEALLATLKQFADQGRTQIGRIELERLVDEVSRVQPDPTTFAEAGRTRAATHPANITQTWQRVVWWDMANRHHDLGYAWSDQELQALRAADVDLPTVETRLAQRTREWLQPILNCTRQLLLVVHHSDEGYHPLVTQITNLFKDCTGIDLETILLDGDAPVLPVLDVPLQPVDVEPLPAPRRWWELPVEVELPARATESYSSLSKLYYSPHEWVLNYQARLRAGRAEDVSDGPRLYGNLAHHLFERFFTEHTDWPTLDDAAIAHWMDMTLPRLIREEGATLLESGRGIDHQRVVTTLERALLRLVEHLRDAGVVSVIPERTESAPFLDGAEVSGTIDLLVTLDDGREAVIDAKWGSEKYRGEELAANAHLQLASYAYMRKISTGANAWPYQAYFIIQTGNMLAPDDHVFPSALVRTPDDGVDVAALWHASEATYAWRREQLDARQVEVNAEGTESTERSTAPDDALETGQAPSRYDDFKRLTGWDAFS